MTKNNLQLYGKIGSDIVIYHGTIVNAEKIGENFSIYQEVSIGKNVKIGNRTSMPSIGDNGSVYANVVVVGEIKIANNVSIGAGVAAMKDVLDNSVVYGNSCIVKDKRK